MPNSDSGSDQPLAGVRVADLSRVLAGPYATMLLSDMGAEVVKVEHPGEGDDTRAWGPPWESGESAYFLSVNRGKRSLAVDLKDPDGAAAVREICAGCDVLIQNFRPGVIDRLGLDYASVRERNPAVVYCSISGFGPEHDPADRPGFDAVMQAESGLMAVTGAGDQASKVGVAITDVLTGLNAAVAILGALLRARVTGQGEHISASLVNSALSGLVNVAQGALATETEPQRYGNAHPAIVPYQVFGTADADIMVAAGNDALFRKLCAVLGRDDLSSDPRYTTNPDRVAHRAELVEEIQAELRTRPAHEWTESLLEAGVPVGKVRGVLDAIRTADAAGDDVTRTVHHPTAGSLELLRAGFRLGTAEGRRDGGSDPPPLLGQHSRQILTEVGLSADRISEMIERGAVRVASNGE
ncbi:crotonobetainyl-CoA:carnitine CoA-transferase CaiB-like acyl-CoA transferase [Haloactinospora alba]|uniref:Crotonobetainyl-CoA:carnitine CoA-transferase CaiB-like acyl-CoA transferase n=1 Tax=Haloactinospora alba TaxID=405555 RepID=A0A543NHI7_9ACTN|nr:CoA transferase [Haloactinospora alba]TQN31312.1 crotonobetainyl-CoA:carnitine CoA-transferase CaiB-like acyl-CoA transferase [Haloactinospora alba]